MTKTFDTTPPLRIALCGDQIPRLPSRPYGKVMPEAILTGITDCGPISPRRIAELRHYREFAELAADETIDAAIVTVPLALREGRVLSLLEAGKHVYCLHPLTGDPNAYARLMHAAETAGLCLMVPTRQQYEPAFTEAARLLAADTIGRLLQVRCFRTHIAPAGKEATGPQWSKLVSEYASEAVGLCRSWLGWPGTVSADIGAGAAKEKERIANIILNHERGISVHHIHQARQFNGWSERYLLEGTRGMFEVRYEPRAEGTATRSDCRLFLHRAGHPTAERTPRIYDQQAGPGEGLCRFFAAIRTGEMTEATAAASLEYLKIALAAAASSRERAKITLALPPDDLR